jgi:DNA invertase Pin-like site-specific DNA recombinase
MSAGIIAGIEVSRFSRSSSDWSRLLRIAALSDTLIMDEDGIYDVNDFNDRLLLGLKGTLSDAELHYLKARMRGGLLNKAKRGELRHAVPIGYAWDENDQIVKDPDAQVQEAIALFFNTFKRTGSAVSLIHEYEKKGFLFPHRKYRGYSLGELSWKKPTLERVPRTLKNPVYAGIYVYGKTQVRLTTDGRKKIIVPKEQCHAWLPNAHPAYISESQFDENNRQLASNTRAKPDSDDCGAVREGPALLQGIAICGKCGRRMTLRYSNSSYANQPIYMCDFDKRHYREAQCQYVIGGNIDRAVETLLLEVVNPLTLDAAVAIQREIAGRKDETLRIYAQQLERARYEMDLAKRRYLRVDPDNRLVAAELEHDWNQKALDFETAKTSFEQKSEAEVRAADEKLKLALEQMIIDFPKIWNDPQTPSREKKRIARLILEDVTITAGSSEIALGIRFKGGATKTIEIPKSTRDLRLVKIEEDAVLEIKPLLRLGFTNQQIADSLNEKGLRIGSQSKPFTMSAVMSLIQRHNLPRRNSLAFSEADGWLTSKEKAAELGISYDQLRRLRKSGKIDYRKSKIPRFGYLYKPQKCMNV